MSEGGGVGLLRILCRGARCCSQGEREVRRQWTGTLGEGSGRSGEGVMEGAGSEGVVER